MDIIEGIEITNNAIIPTPNGSVKKFLSKTESAYKGFGEVYFSEVHHKAIKGWKKHHLMWLNLIVPCGEVEFVFFDDRIESPTNGYFNNFRLSDENYLRLTIPPKIWFAFKGIGEGVNLISNFASIVHTPNEVETLPLEDAKFNEHVW